jgi:hypothetical protein
MSDGIPPVQETDAEDVAWALQTAEALWKRNERVDAIVWLRRAAQAAGEAEDNDRALGLARNAAELSDWMASAAAYLNSMSAPPPPLAPEEAHLAPETEASPVDAFLNAGIGGDTGTDDDGPAIEIGVEDDVDTRLSDYPQSERPTRDFEEVPTADPDELQSTQARVSTQAKAIDTTLPSHGQRPRFTSTYDPRTVPTAAETHAGMLDPWAENEAATASTEIATKAIEYARVASQFDEDEVITSAARSPGDRAANVADEPTPDSTPTAKSDPPVPSGIADPIHSKDAPTQFPNMLAPPMPPSSSRMAVAQPIDHAMRRPLPPLASPVKMPPPRPPPPPAPSRPRNVSAGSSSYRAVAPPPASQHTQLSAPNHPLINAMARTEIDPPSFAPETLMQHAPQTFVEEPDPPTIPPPRMPLPFISREATPTPPPMPAPAPVPDIAPLIAVSHTPSRLDLNDVAAFADLPEDARDDFANKADIIDLARDEEVSGFALAFVIDGEVDIAATIVDAPAARFGAKAILRSRGTTSSEIPIRLIAASAHATVATWKTDVVDAVFKSCPWIEDDLRAEADKVQVIVGATMGPLGERLDMALRAQVLGRLTTRVLAEGEVFVEMGKPVPGLVLVGVGCLELAVNGVDTGSLDPGEFLFPQEVLGAGASPATVRAGKGGAIILVGGRMLAQELLVTCPPLLEIFAGM